MSDHEEENRLTASEVCLASVQEDCILDEDVTIDVNPEKDTSLTASESNREDSDKGPNPEEELAEGSRVEVETDEESKGASWRKKRRKIDDGIADPQKQKTAEEKLSENVAGEDNVENVDNALVEPTENGQTEMEAIPEQEERNESVEQKFTDENCLRNKDNSESDTRVSTTSDNSTKSKVIRRRRKRAPCWFRKKRRRASKGRSKGDESDVTRSTIDDCVSGNTSPSLSENYGGKNRKSSDSSDNSKKHREFAIPSPSLADISMKAAIPESTATSIEISKQGLCLCRKKPQIFISGNNNAGDLYCQGLDSINNRIIGCCNPIPSQDVGLFRASEKACFQMMCNLHQQRLLRHNCCPGCGLFCTKGKFLMCKSMHHYHRMCSTENENGVLVCPHCGDDAPPKSIVIIMNSVKDPILLPQQKPPRTVKAAKISITRGLTQILDEDVDPVFKFPQLPLTFLHQQQQITNGELKQSNEDTLAHFLSIACSSHPDLSNIFGTRRCTYKSLYTAVEVGDVGKVLKMLAAGLNPNHEFDEHNKCNALHVAAANGHLTVVHVLLQARSQINAMDSEQNTPLTLAIIKRKNDVVKYLIKCGADLTMKGEDGMTPLHIAAKSGNVGACYHILNGTKLPPRYVDCLDDGGWTPMVWASEFNHLEVVRFLLCKGADPFVRDAEQNIALHWAAFGGSIDIVELYLNDGSDINAVNVQGDTPLHIAARQDKYECVLLLLARGADSNIKNKAGEYARDCTDSPESDIYKGITLNMEISTLLGRFQERTPKIVSNDVSHGKERNQIQCVNGVDDEPEPEDFVYVTESCFTSKITVDRTINSLQYCKCSDNCNTCSCNCANISINCWYDSEGRLKPDFNYADPPMIFECNQACQCNRITCHNRVIQNGISCRFQLFKTEGRGWGIKTLNHIQKGTYVCEYVGEIISDCEADHREDDSYLFDLDNRDGETYCIDARRYGNFARFINHMCVPNLMPVHVFVDHQDIRFPRIAFFANRDILPEEELGYNYGEKFWVIKWKSFTCSCGAEKCMYSEKTIKTTLENYSKKLQEENA